VGLKVRFLLTCYHVLVDDRVQTYGGSVGGGKVGERVEIAGIYETRPLNQVGAGHQKGQSAVMYTLYSTPPLTKRAHREE
jgi:hypothetical protein